MNLIHLLAEITATGRVAEASSSADGGFGWLWLIALVAIAGLSGVATWLIWRWRIARHRQSLNCPSQLLVELCKRHGLTSQERRLIAGLAREQDFEHPAMLFVDPQAWETAQSGQLSGKHAAAIAALRQRLQASS
ncbi:MAG TPA: hypothetical protein VFV87_19705 [Pirellulaceae bacterium]|nr:hypothetical protein [Pirellulaceae bacterium]